MVSAVGAALLAAGVLVVGAAGCDDDSLPIPEQTEFTASVEVTNDVGLLGSIALDLRYHGSIGGFVSEGEDVRCDITAPGAFGVVTRRASDRVSVGISSFAGIETPGPLVRCRVRSVGTLSAADLAVRVREAIDPTGFPPADAPAVEVTDVVEAGTTTTTSVGHAASTTTLAGH